MKSIKFICIASLICLVAGLAVAKPSSSLQAEFNQPPAKARPWVYWFWLNSNITKAGITADLEAMKRAGIGGVLIMEVDQGAPVGKVAFASPLWNEMFRFVCSEANRLGIEVNMNDDAGWNGSGGPWVTPENAMKKVVWTETNVQGGQKFEANLTRPETVMDYYRDIRVVAFPAVGAYRIPDVNGKSALERQEFPVVATYPTPPEGSVIDLQKSVNLTDKMDATGKLVWDVPPGNWTIMRIGYTLTGAQNGPAPASGTGLECDKLSKSGTEENFNGFINKLVQENKALAGKSFVATHIDSWENGSQNWTAKFAEEFKARRGYDPLPYLPVYSGRVINSLEESERFLWDVRQTVSDLVLENYADHTRELAHKQGLRLTIEAYGNCTFEDLAYAGRADEPMAEFWSWPKYMAGSTLYEMASAAHVYGKPILGAEAFTAIDSEKWQGYPGNIKGLGDWAFCRGVNRFVFHRFAMQPFLNVAPGMSMGPWGLHYERTQTWWEQSGAWHKYLARCQYLLQKGLTVIDLLYMAPEGAPSSFTAPQSEYSADACPAEVVLKRLTVKDGKLVLPDGMSYRALVLPSGGVMSPELLRKVKSLVEAGATVVGERPTKSPSLTNFPACDDEVQALARDLWDSDKVFTYKTPAEIMGSLKLDADFKSNRNLDYIHKKIDDADVYFVANKGGRTINATCQFRIADKQPEIWNPDTGSVSSKASYDSVNGLTHLDLALGPNESTFVVFRKPAEKSVNVEEIGGPTNSSFDGPVIKKATWGPVGDAARTKDVTARVQEFVNSGRESFTVSELVVDGDPAFGVVKTLNVEYTIGSRTIKVSGTDPELISFELPSDWIPGASVVTDAKGAHVLEVNRPGQYKVDEATINVPSWKTQIDLAGAWKLDFPIKGKSPLSMPLTRLVSWSEMTNETAKYYSGTGTYTKTFNVPASTLKGTRVMLNLGKVEVMAQVLVNGKDLGVLWHTPYEIDVTRILNAGENRIEVRATNLWINRMIGDEFLPEDSDRHNNGTLKTWPDWVLGGKTSPTGRKSFTSWRLWGKNDKLFPSGLIGPVTLRVTKLIPIAAK